MEVQGAIIPLIARGLSPNLLVQDILGQSEVYVNKTPKVGGVVKPNPNAKGHCPSGNILMTWKTCLG